MAEKRLRFTDLGSRDLTEALKLNSENVILTFQDTFEGDGEDGEEMKRCLCWGAGGSSCDKEQ